MSIRNIFDQDPDSKPRQFDDIVGQFRSGAMQSGRPVALEEWRVTTGDPEIALTIKDLFGGDEAATWEAKGEDNLEVYTTTKEIDVVLDGANAIRSAMALWGRNGLIHRCDGETMTDGKACATSGLSVAERKDAAKEGWGCEPSIQVYFRLAATPDLGKFKFSTGSWSLAAVIGDAETALEKIDGPAKATLSLELVEYTTKKGRDVRYTKPVIKITGPAE